MASLSLPHPAPCDDSPRHSQECAVRHGELCDCQAWTYQQTLSEAATVTTDTLCLMWIRAAQGASRNSLRMLALNKAREFADNRRVLDLIDEAEELI